MADMQPQQHIQRDDDCEIDSVSISTTGPGLQTLPNPDFVKPPNEELRISPTALQTLPIPDLPPSGEQLQRLSNEDVTVPVRTGPPPGDVDLASALVKQRKFDDDSLAQFLSGIDTQAESASFDARQVLTGMVSLVFPNVCVLLCIILGLILAISSFATPSSGGNVSSMKIALVICSAVMLVGILWLGFSFGVIVYGAYRVDLDEANLCCTACLVLIVLGFPFVFILVVLCGIAILVVSCVLGSTLGSSVSSVIPWLIFTTSLGTVVCVCFGSAFMLALLLKAACGDRCCKGCPADECLAKCICVLTCGCVTDACLKRTYYAKKMRRIPCVKNVAEDFIYQQLQIHSGWFDGVNCYCQRCWGLGSFPDTQKHGDKKYAVPRLWTRFSLPPVRGADVRGLDKWHLAYHGTSGLSAKAILESQRILMPGDRRPDGGHIEIRPGHIKDESFARNVFMSPSITYVSCPVYCVDHEHRLEGEEQKRYRVLVALELIQPESYEVGPETLGARERDVIIDPLFPSEEIEWFTNRRGVMELNGLLVKVEEISE